MRIRGYVVTIHAAAMPPSVLPADSIVGSQSGSEPHPSRCGNPHGTTPRQGQLRLQGSIRLQQANRNRPEE